MAFPIRFSHVLAIGLTAGVGFYMLNGTTMVSGTGPIDPDNPARADQSSLETGELFAVQARDIVEMERPNILVLRGRTEADATVSVSAETGGRVIEVAVSEGDRVQAGDVLCRLDEAARRASVAQAEAALTQAEIQLNAASSLAENGFGAQNQVPVLLANFEASQAALEQAQIELERTVIAAPVDGLVQLPLAEVGVHLDGGALCATLVDSDPLIVTGQVSEVDISDLQVDMSADVTLVTGEVAEGHLSFISAVADPSTRTFRVDISVPNPDGALRSGITAQADIALPATRAHFVPLSVLGLNDDGDVGVRTLDADNRVAFNPITIIGDERGGVWVTGLEETVRVIVVGQDFVVAGDEVAVELVQPGEMQTSQIEQVQSEGAAQ